MTDRIALAPSRLFDGESLHEGHAVVFEGDRVVEVREAQASDSPIAGTLTPGFVDWQVNGAGGELLGQGDPDEALRTIARVHAALGTTTVVPTLITSEPRTADEVADAIARAVADEVDGIVGVHYEGPHLSAARCGAHEPSFLRDPVDADVDRLTRSDTGVVVTTVAPERVGAGWIESLVGRGVRVSLGHSDCDAGTAGRAFDAGASAVTHLFNAMSPLHHREPGLVGAALAARRCFLGLIADGHHVAADALRIATVAGFPDRLTLVSDAMPTVGMKGDSFELDGRTVHRLNGALRLQDGTLAGSDLDLARALRFLVNAIRAPLDAALRSVTSNPARFLGLEAVRGCLRPGARADFVLLDEGLEVERVWVGGGPLTD